MTDAEKILVVTKIEALLRDNYSIHIYEDAAKMINIGVAQTGHAKTIEAKTLDECFKNLLEFSRESKRVHK